MKLLPMIQIHQSTKGQWQYSKLSTWSCHLDLKSNSHNWFTRKCVAAEGDNWPFNSHERSRQNFSIQYQYNIKQISDENKEKYQFVNN